jgi:hypothetical protein
MRIVFTVLIVMACCCILLARVERKPQIRHSTGAGAFGDDPERPLPSLMSSSGSFARRVLSPRVGGLESGDSETLQVVLERLRPRRKDALSALLHAMHLYGPAVTVEVGVGERVPALELILDADRAKGAGFRFGDGQVLARTSYGYRFPPTDSFRLGLDQSNTESHRGQGLATLASVAVPLNTRITADGGGEGRVADILNDLVANFSLEGEIFWDATALAIYLPPNRGWKDKFGRTYTFDDLAGELLRRPPDGSSCVGTHILIDLAILLRADAESPLLSPVRRSALRSHLGDAVARLGRSRLAEGGWGRDWHERDGSESTPREIVISTGHHLEWLMLLPDDLRPDLSVLVRAAKHGLRILSYESKDPEWVRLQYCPATHAARSARLLIGPG